VLQGTDPQPISERNRVGGGVQVTSAPASVSFDLNGRVISGDGAVVRFALTDGNQRRRCISLDPSGRPRSTTTECPTT
jgi:type IV fimbrial biogenesis protein FimT